ncbi:hypothetical protein [Streptomyces pacificus]|uniref:Uncharacterized protein n=1 Tax=Streptomyces pacificus TaxID=2705029 RepID=A0A6A0AU28_9ACTN|nr:hypothetical protein [Streptomyces pacificus]GFH35384.1 hypothetical protein SCWH03_16000 [Streptomyces pacificus]
MSENEQPLTPQQQQSADAAQIRTRFGATDAVERFAATMDDIGFGSVPGGFFGRTDFESRQLNEMLDLVENSNPADLERAGEALVRAKSALNEAAGELSDYVGRVEWKGEAATEFRRFGDALAKHAYALATFANAAGTQMTVAGTGLASVRNSMPRERDNRPVAKTVEDFALTPDKENDPEYQEALRVERNRQEAINQMNRLASFYAVSEESLAAQQPPAFPGALGTDVPRPKGGHRGESPSAGGDAGDGSLGGKGQQQAARSDTGEGEGAWPGARGASPQAVERSPVMERSTSLNPGTSMAIDSVATPPAPAAASGGTPLTVASGAGNPGGSLPPVPPAFGGNAVRGVSSRASTPGVPPPGGGSGANAVGRPGVSGGGVPAAGRAGAGGGAGGFGSPAAPGTQGMPGRPSGSFGAGGAAGQAAAGASGQGPVVGRPGAAGQSAFGPAGQSPSAGGRTGHSSGIVGGTPQRPVSGSAGSRMPKGTVVGTETPAQGRSAVPKPNQSGVIGAHADRTAQRVGAKGAASANGLAGGTPRGGRQGAQSAAGSVSGAGQGRQQSGNQKRRRGGTPRPDYLTEDEETWKTQRRGAVPPVIDQA